MFINIGKGGKRIMKQRKSSRDAPLQPSRWHIFLSAGVLALLILALLLSSKLKRGGAGEAQLSDFSAREIKGLTIEERLSTHDIDASSARITKITDADSLKRQYSAIFKEAKIGHYLVETPDAILVYDFEHDRIVARFEFRRITVE